jgi:cyanuric acid amidohydrolase
MQALVHRLETASPGDVSGLEALLERGALRADEVVAILGKTEGNGGRNDFTRELACQSYARLLARRLDTTPEQVEERVVLSMSGGTEGVATPHVVVFGRRGAPLAAPRAAKRLAIGVGHTRPFEPEEIGRSAQILETARAVRAVARGMGLASLRDVHMVQMKGAIPGASFERLDEARRRGVPIVSDMAHSRAASALGAAVATGEIEERLATDDAVLRRFDLFSSVASVSAKPHLARTEIIVLGNSPTWEGDLAIEHGVMRDLLDVDAARDVLGRLGITFPQRPSPDQLERVVAVFAKSEADPRGAVRGRRHVMLDDDDVSDTRWSRCTLHAVLASVVGDGRVYVSTRAEHMGPLGGGPLAIVARVG